MAKNLGVTIREERERAGMTQSALASRLNMTPGNLSKLEKGDGKATPRFDTVARIAAVLGLSLDELAQTCGYLPRPDANAKDAASAAALAKSLRRAQEALDTVGASIGDAANRLERRAETNARKRR